MTNDERDAIELVLQESEALCEQFEAGCIRCEAVASVRKWLARQGGQVMNEPEFPQVWGSQISVDEWGAYRDAWRARYAELEARAGRREAMFKDPLTYSGRQDEWKVWFDALVLRQEGKT